MPWVSGLINRIFDLLFITNSPNPPFIIIRKSDGLDGMGNLPIVSFCIILWTKSYLFILLNLQNLLRINIISYMNYCWKIREFNSWILCEKPVILKKLSNKFLPIWKI